MTFIVIIIALIVLYLIMCVINDMFRIKVYWKRYKELKHGVYSISDVQWRIGDKFGHVDLSSELEYNAIIFFGSGDIKIKTGVYYFSESIFNGPISYYYYRKYWKLIKILVQEYNNGRQRTFISGRTYNMITVFTGNSGEKKTFKFLK